MERRKKTKDVCYVEPKVDDDEPSDFSPDVSLYEEEHIHSPPKGENLSKLKSPIEQKITTKQKPVQKHEIPETKDAVYTMIINGTLYIDDPPPGRVGKSTQWKQGMQFVYHEEDNEVCETWYCCNICAWLYKRAPGESTSNIKNHAEKHTRETYKLDRTLLARIIAKTTSIAKSTGPLSEARIKKILPSAPISSEIFLDSLLPGATVQKDAVVEVVAGANESLQQRALRIIRQTPKKIVDETKAKPNNEANLVEKVSIDVLDKTKTAKSPKNATDSFESEFENKSDAIIHQATSDSTTVAESKECAGSGQVTIPNEREIGINTTKWQEEIDRFKQMLCRGLMPQSKREKIENKLRSLELKCEEEIAKDIQAIISDEAELIGKRVDKNPLFFDCDKSPMRTIYIQDFINSHKNHLTKLVKSLHKRCAESNFDDVDKQKEIAVLREEFNVYLKQMSDNKSSQPSVLRSNPPEVNKPNVSPQTADDDDASVAVDPLKEANTSQRPPDVNATSKGGDTLEESKHTLKAIQVEDIPEAVDLLENQNRSQQTKSKQVDKTTQSEDNHTKESKKQNTGEFSGTKRTNSQNNSRPAKKRKLINTTKKTQATNQGLDHAKFVDENNFSGSEDGPDVDATNLKDDINEIMSDEIKFISDCIDDDIYIFSSDKREARYEAIAKLKKKYSKSVTKDVQVLNNYIDGLRNMGYLPSVLKSVRESRLQSIRRSFNKKMKDDAEKAKNREKRENSETKKATIKSKDPAPNTRIRTRSQINKAAQTPNQ